MAIYQLTRQAPQGKAVKGQLSAGEQNHPVAPTLENADYLIPTGVYRVVVTLSPRFGTLMPLVSQVPGRYGIRIHGGTKPQHSHGCILITRRDAYQRLVQQLLREQENAEPIYLNIVQQ